MGRFLVFEGLDGSGKSTLIQGLAAALRDRTLSHLLTREPGGTPLAEEIRRMILRTDGESPVAVTELLLYAASRAQHVARVIQPALMRSEWVLCDRFAASTVAFQGFARGLPRAEIDWLNCFAQQGVRPDLYFLLDVSVAATQRRAAERGHESGTGADRMEREPGAFHEAVRQGYLAQAREAPEDWVVLDATKKPEALLQDALGVLREKGWLES